MGSPLTVDVEMRNSYQTTVAFNWMGHAYEFSVTKWSGPGFGPFIQRFFAHRERDPSIFGRFTLDEGFQATVHQRSACLRRPGFSWLTNRLRHMCIYHATSDIFKCIDAILRKHAGGLINYAISFLQTAKYDTGMYRDYITVTACEAILQCHLLAPSVHYEDVRFSD